jgi:hypothetical protein
LVAIVALLLAVPMERGRACDICPVDCPMHGAHHVVGQVGCHHAAESAHDAAPGRRCAMRAGCAHASSTLIAFHGELPLSLLRIGVEARRLAVGVPSSHGIGVSTSQPHPPESVVV